MHCILTRWLGYVFIIFGLMLAYSVQVTAHDFGGASLHGEPPGTWNKSGTGGGGEAGPDAGNNSIGGKIYPYDGSEYFSANDLALRGVFPIIITRSYNSHSTYDSPAGYGWDIPYTAKLYTYADNSALIRWHTGFKQRFIYSGGAFTCDVKSKGTLVENGDGSFTYTGFRGIQYLFDVEGKLTSIIDNHGNSLRMTHNSGKKPLVGISPFSLLASTPQIVSYDYQLTRVEQWDSTNTFSGRFVDFSYDDTTGRLDEISDFSGRTISYQYDDKGNLTRVDFPEGLHNVYSYDDPNDIHNITSIGRGYGTTPLRILYTNVYDDQDRVVSQQEGNGLVEIDYTIPLIKTTITKTIRNETGEMLHQATSIMEFNDTGHVVKVTDPQKNLFQTIRDAQGNPVRVISWKNVGSFSSPSLIQERITEYTHDTDGNRTSSAITLDSGEGITNTFTYDHNWLKTWVTTSTFEPGVVRWGEHVFEYNGEFPKHISLRRVLTSNNPSPQYDTVSFIYDSSGQLLEVSYPNGDKEQHTYTNGYLTNSNGVILERDTLGNVTSIFDLNNNETKYEYNTHGRIIKLINPLNEETVFQYTGSNLTEVESGIVGVNPGKKINYLYDNLGRIITVSMDLNGSPVMGKSYTYDSAGNILSLTNSLNQTWIYAYDQLGRMISTIDPEENSTLYQYDLFNNLEQVTDSQGNIIYNNYDKLNRLILVTDNTSHSTRYMYNSVSNLTKIVDSNNNSTIFGYDLSGAIIWKQDASGMREQYSYDAKGRLQTVVDSEENSINYEYTSRNMLNQITFSDNPSKVINFIYDVGDNLTGYIDTAYSSSPMQTWTYDALNRIDTVTYPAIDKVLDYDYNRYGLREKISCLSGATELFSYSYSYDNATRLSSIIEMPRNAAVSFGYDTEGREVVRTYGNGSKVISGFTPNNSVHSLEFQKADTTVIDSYQFAYDHMKHITSFSAFQGTATFDYDQLYQVVSADYPETSELNDEQYTYDSNGNRLTSTSIQNWLYNKTNQLQSFGSTSFTYDHRGNRLTQTISGITTHFSYDELGMLSSVTAPNLSSVYTYDYLNRRIKKNVNGNVSWYLYDQNNLLAEFDENGDLVLNYLYQPGSGDLLTISDTSDNFTVLTNHIGSPISILNELEVTVWKATYQLFGETVLDEDPDGDSTIFTCNHRFPGQYYDQESGLNYNHFRYYDPKTASYLQKDSLEGSVDQPFIFNPYLYTSNSPLVYSDPLGLKQKRKVHVLTEEVMTNLLMSMAARLNDIKKHWWINVPGRYYDFLDEAGDLDSWFRATQASVLPDKPNEFPDHATLYTMEGDPKKRVYHGHELNYLLQGMLYEHLNLFWGIEYPLIRLWKTRYDDGALFTPTSQFWANRGRAMYQKIMTKYKNNPKVSYPKLNEMEKKTLGEGGYRLEAPQAYSEELRRIKEHSRYNSSRGRFQ